jgi:uncharacterized protein
VSLIEPEDTARTLKEVQEFDTKILGLEREIEGLADTHRLGELRAGLEEAEAALAAREAELDDIKLRQLKLDGELDLLSQKIEKEEARMMSGTIMNPKELQSIQQEIFSLRKKRDEMETEDLEEMEAIDALRAALKEAGEAVEEATRGEAEAKRTYDAELAEKQSEVARLEVERDELKAGLEEDTIAAYEKLLATKDGLAVVQIVQGRSCGGCHIEFSRTQIDRFQHEEGVFRCEYCRRMLVK